MAHAEHIHRPCLFPESVPLVEVGRGVVGFVAVDAAFLIIEPLRWHYFCTRKNYES